MPHKLTLLALAAALTLLSARPAAAAPAVTTVELTGWSAPALVGLKFLANDTNGAGATFSNLRVGDDGQLTFTARLSGPGAKVMGANQSSKS